MFCCADCLLLDHCLNISSMLTKNSCYVFNKFTDLVVILELVRSTSFGQLEGSMICT